MQEAADQGAIKMISKRKLLTLLADKRAAVQNSRSIAGELGSKIKELAENDNLHKKAFATFAAMDRMEPEALADFLAHLDYYMECGGIRKRASSVMRMPLGDDADPAARTSNVKAFPSPSGMAAE
jgi:hypothetical protein